MPTVIELPNNQRATLRASEELSNRDVKLLRRAARKVGLVGQHLKDLGLDDLQQTNEADEATEPDETAIAVKNARALAILTEISDEEDDSLDLFQRTCTSVRLLDWTLDLPLPKTPEDVDLLPRPLYEALTAAAAKLDLNESFDVDGAGDPKAGTESSENSEQPLPEEPSPNP